MDNELTHISLNINGVEYSLNISANLTLLDLLRENIGLSGTKKGCDSGQCGACTVLIDGIAVNSCIILAIQADGKNITTIEGINDGKTLHPIQKSFVEENAIQCGFCTPGMIMSAKDLLDHNSNPTDFEIKEALSGNLCRCTGYTKIINAVNNVSNKIYNNKIDSVKEDENG